MSLLFQLKPLLDGDRLSALDVRLLTWISEVRKHQVTAPIYDSFSEVLVLTIIKLFLDILNLRLLSSKLTRSFLNQFCRTIVGVSCVKNQLANVDYLPFVRVLRAEEN